MDAVHGRLQQVVDHDHPGPRFQPALGQALEVEYVLHQAHGMLTAPTDLLRYVSGLARRLHEKPLGPHQHATAGVAQVVVHESVEPVALLLRLSQFVEEALQGLELAGVLDRDRCLGSQHADDRLITLRERRALVLVGQVQVPVGAIADTDWDAEKRGHPGVRARHTRGPRVG